MNPYPVLLAVDERSDDPIPSCVHRLRTAKALGLLVDSEDPNAFAGLELTEAGRRYLEDNDR